MSARSAKTWGWAPGFARGLLGRFALILAQTEADAARFSALAGRKVPCWGNLKYAAPPLPADAAELARLKAAWAGRPVWLAASTHPGEDEIILSAHRLLAPDHPGLLTVIVPRHPPRGPDIAGLAGDLPVARRGAGQEAGQGVAVYVADTLGELGLFYRGGSAGAGRPGRAPTRRSRRRAGHGGGGGGAGAGSGRPARAHRHKPVALDPPGAVASPHREGPVQENSGPLPQRRRSRADREAPGKVILAVLAIGAMPALRKV